MKKTILGGLTCLLFTTVSIASFAGGSQDAFDTLAYLQFRVGESMAPRCAERLPEYEVRFKRALSAWSMAYHKRIERGRGLAWRAAEQGKGDLEAEINRRGKDSKRAFAQMNEAEVRSRCEAILEELGIRK